MRAHFVADLRPALQDWSDPVAVGVDFDGAIYAVARRSSESLTETRGIGIFPKSRLDRATDYLVVRWAGGETRSVVVRDESVAVSFVQPVSGGLLLAGVRCRWRPEGPEENAVVVDWSGLVRSRFTLGDGIADLRVTRQGMIWAAYFDEGVFGNYGWGNPGPPPIGAPGLVAFSEAGEVLFSYDAGSAKTDDIADVYAMNVAGDGAVWLYFYTDFSIVRIVDGSYRVWSTDQQGAGALAAREDRALLFGDYERRNLARIVDLDRGGVARVVKEVEIEDEHGKPIGRLQGRGVGADLFLYDRGRVLVLRDW